MIALEKLTQLFQHCFQLFHQTKFALYCGIIFCSSLVAYWAMLFFRRHRSRYSLTGYLFISADKSESNALQMGGLPFSVIAVLSIGLLFYFFPYLIGPQQRTLLLYAVVTWVGLFAYGHVDDRYEVRPVAKLAAQLCMVSVFALGAANTLFPENSAYAFLVITPLATIILNGTNLIDGLDTLSYKISSVTYLAFVVLAAYINCLPALFIAVSCFFIMTAFYFFNREPSRIHLGEVGVSCLGFSYVLLATLIFDGYNKLNPLANSVTKALLPVTIVLLEVLVSFSRRCMNGKSPFRGDKLHVHHILHSIYGLGAATSSTVIAGVNLLIMLTALYVMDEASSVTAFALAVVLQVLWTLGIGRRHWFRGHLRIELFGAMFVHEKMKIIPSDSLAEFSVVLTNHHAQQVLRLRKTKQG